ncbi:MAG: FTR1 family iron permease [Ruminococcus sp.]|nr:FTR1 family iron permease [Ruminococcus sp.]
MTSKLRRISAVSAVILVLAVIFCMSASAAEATPFYETWEEAQPVYFPDSTTTNMNEVAYAIDKVIEAGHHNLENGFLDEAYQCAQQGYYGYYEVCGFERRTMAEISGARKNEVEFIYRDLRKAVKSESLADYDEAAKKLRIDLYEDAQQLSDISPAFVEKFKSDKEFASYYTEITGYDQAKLEELAGVERTNAVGSAASSFLQAFIILLREGLEAILVIGGIIAYLIKSGNKKQVKSVYIGSVFAIALSFVAAWVLGIIKSANAAAGANQEIIEGITALLAVAVLFYVSNWMLSKSESEVWQNYLNKQVESSVSKGSMFALGFTAFLAVFREGAEVILFYQPIIADAQEGDGVGFVWLGVLVAVVALVAVFIAIRYFSVKLPLKPFFMATSILMAVMAIAFLGSGIKELIEGGLLDNVNIYIPGLTPLIEQIPTNDVLDIFGIYPHTETIIPQFILLVITIILFIVQIRRSKKLKSEIRAKAENAE